MVAGTHGLTRILGIGIAWCALWLASGLTLASAIGILDPDSIDPGDIRGMVLVFGSMGFLSGAAFALLSSLSGGTLAAQSFARAAQWGLVATAIVQVAYLNHGDAGLAANITMALAFAAFGGFIAMVWLALARRWKTTRETRIVQ